MNRDRDVGMRMTVRPRLWRIGALKLYIGRMAPLAVICWSNIVTAFIAPFLRTQMRENWTKRSLDG